MHVFQHKREPVFSFWFSCVVSCLWQEAAQRLDATVLSISVALVCLHRFGFHFSVS